MKRTLFTLALGFALAPAVNAQEHQHQHADSSRTVPMEHGDMMSMEDMQAMMMQMMRMHERMMADSTMHRMMMADPEMRQLMQQMRKGGMKGHEGMDHDEMHQKMHGEDGMDHSGMKGHRPGDAEGEVSASASADRFHSALTAGDRAAVEALLLPDVVVLEGGQAETRTEYLGHHFGNDAAFLAAVAREPLTRRTTVAGDAAWVASTSRLRGTYQGRALDLDSAELLVLRRDASAPGGWRIAAVHWSSAARK